MKSRESRLARFLADPKRPVGTLSYYELQGFLFAVASAPDLVRPSEWMPAIFDDKPAVYEDLEEAQAVLAELMMLYNAVNEHVRSERPTLPAGVRFRPRTSANFDDGAPISMWSRGFLRGHSWLEESWSDVPDEMDSEFAMMIMALTFFSSERLARAYALEIGNSEFDAVAEMMRGAFRDAGAEYARLGRTIHQALDQEVPREARPATPTKIGRNVPCPCGSGRKYKKCCGPGATRPH